MQREGDQVRDDRGGAGSSNSATLLEQVYDELRALAAGFLRRERGGHTLQPTALVHEAYLRLARHADTRWQGREHYRAMAALVIRRLLADHARRGLAERRGGGWSRVTVGEGLAFEERDPGLTLALEQALDDLRAFDARLAQVVELHHFGGLTIAQTAAALHCASRTVDDDWRLARAWLRRALAEREP